MPCPYPDAAAQSQREFVAARQTQDGRSDHLCCTRGLNV